MSSYKMRVRLPNGMITEVEHRAISGAVARQMVEAQYGAGSFLGFL